MFGTLYVVSTPIGNLEDITLRALRVLKEAHVIAAEDTRHTARLLQRYDIRTSTTSFHEHNERQKLPVLLERLKSGEHVAVVSDAGTPGINDPGYRLVRAAVESGVRVEAIPGPSALLAALVSSGLPVDVFTFLGFAPARASARAAWIERLAAQRVTVVFFEAPHRIRQTLEGLAGAIGTRQVAVCRELTKVHEETLRGSASALLSALPEPRGEFTVVVGPPTEGEAKEPPTDECLWDAFRDMVTRSGTDRRAAISALAKRYGLSSKTIYAALERQKAAAEHR